MNLESLLVCRDAEVVRVLRPTLEKLSIEVEVSAAARSGAEILSSAKFDAVIVDCDDLQGGVDVLRSLRQNASNKTSVSFAILNGKTTTHQAFEMGANFVLQKPVTTAGTLRCFHTALAFMIREKRRYFRCAVEFPVVLVCSQSEEIKATATNLSEGGMAIHFEGALAKRPGLKVRFALPETKVTMEPQAEIAWADGLGRAGVKFVDVPESSREQLEKWILRRIERAARS
ncbi:MAG TPA: response regulator [Terriglobales bacterium]|jgi:DNA-binding response OmpR family regulator|nr:response regulator [Terriglobales bacterium]